MDIQEQINQEIKKIFPQIIKDCIYKYLDPYKEKYNVFVENVNIQNIIELRNKIKNMLSFIIEEMMNYWVQGDSIFHIVLPITNVYNSYKFQFKLIFDEIYICLAFLPIYIYVNYTNTNTNTNHCYKSCILLKCKPKKYLNSGEKHMLKIPVYNNSHNNPKVYIDMLNSLDFNELIDAQHKLLSEYEKFKNNKPFIQDNF
jgi:hypothetical protein